MERWPIGPQDALVVVQARNTQQAADAAAERLLRLSSGRDRRGSVGGRPGLRGSFGRLLIRIGSALAGERAGAVNGQAHDGGLA
ncbi:MAG TPA: hypothetical protein VFI28_08620 [Candidatus Limnocylindrales bacterium]|nr:hypothetical protein [Candidatus Limnocylindrales bacterium]